MVIRNEDPNFTSRIPNEKSVPDVLSHACCQACGSKMIAYTITPEALRAVNSHVALILAGKHLAKCKQLRSNKNCYGCEEAEKAIYQAEVK